MKSSRRKIAGRGAKLVVQENAKTVFFYKVITLSTTLLYMIMLLQYYQSLSRTIISLYCFSTAFNMLCLNFMCLTARPTYSANGHLQDSGTDLNLEGSIIENCKDVMIIMSYTIFCSTFNNYCWWFLVLLPLRGLQILCKFLISQCMSYQHKHE